MGMIHPAIVNDSGPGLDGTVWNDAWETLHDAAIDLAIGAASGASSPTTTGTQTALTLPAGSGGLIEYLNNATLLTIQGIVAGVPGQLLALVSKGAGQVDLAHLHTSGTALGKLHLFATSGLTSLAPGSGVAVLQYDGTLTKWRLVAHEQGAFITPTYAAGAFTGSAGTWTVDAGDVGNYSYKLSGRRLTVWFFVTTSSVASPGAGLNIAIPGGFTATAKTFVVPFFYNDSGGATTVGICEVDPSAVIIRLLKIGFGNWTAATNTTTVQGLADIEVT